LQRAVRVPGDHFAAVELDGGNSLLVWDAADGIEQVEPAQTERLHRGGDSVRDGLRRSDIHRAVIDFRQELLVGRWPPAALACCPVELFLVVRPLDLEGLVIGLGDETERVQPDR
jgi:hypothetical protein